MPVGQRQAEGTAQSFGSDSDPFFTTETRRHGEIAELCNWGIGELTQTSTSITKFPNYSITQLANPQQFSVASVSP